MEDHHVVVGLRNVVVVHHKLDVRGARLVHWEEGYLLIHYEVVHPDRMAQVAHLALKGLRKMVLKVSCVGHCEVVLLVLMVEVHLVPLVMEVHLVPCVKTDH